MEENYYLHCRFAIDSNPVRIGQTNGDTEVVAIQFNSVLIKEYLWWVLDYMEAHPVLPIIMSR